MLMETGVEYARSIYEVAGEQIISSGPLLGSGLSQPGTKEWDCVGNTHTDDRKKSGYGGNDDADLINLISAIDGNKVGMIFVEQSDNHVKDFMACTRSRG